MNGKKIIAITFQDEDFQWTIWKNQLSLELQESGSAGNEF
jgi:hypothetical protein